MPVDALGRVRSLAALCALLPIAASAAPISFATNEGTWLSVTMSRDGSTVLFDLLGDIYRLRRGDPNAEPLITGTSFDTQPVFSPDGGRIAFISDRGGSENVWIADANGANARALSQETGVVFVSPAWSADGQSVLVTRFSSRSRLDREIKTQLWIFDLSGRSGPLHADSSRLLGASLSRDGRFVYYSAGGNRGKYDIIRRDLRTDESVLLISGGAYASGVLQPTVSSDGATLAYAVDVEGRTELRLRDLRTGADRALVPRIEPSLARQSPAFQGLLPHYEFTADSKAIVIAYGGQIRRIDVTSGASEVIPFKVNVHLDTAPRVQPKLPDETGPVRARIIQAPQLAPDGKRVAFSAFGKVYVAALPGGKGKRLTRTPLSEDAMTENQPSWSADGRWIVYASWSRRDGGHLWRVRSTGEGEPQRLTRVPGNYRKPAYTPDGESIVALRSSSYEQVNLLLPRGSNPERPAAQQLVRVPAGGGDNELLAYLPPSVQRVDHGRLHFTPDAKALLVHTSSGLMQVPLEGGTPRTVLEVVGSNVLKREAAVDELMLSPDGRWALVLQNFQLHLLAVPAEGQRTRIDLNAPRGFARQITQIGADELGWSADGKSVTWSVGSSFFRIPLQRLLQEFTAESESQPAACSDDHYDRVNIDVSISRDVPDTNLVLRGAKVVTMRGDETIDNADVLVRGNRIAAVGPSGSVAVPPGAVIHDVSGKTITPGFADSHAHYWRVGRQVLDYDNWEYRIALAYGITTSIDPQSFTNDMFAYQDLLDAGIMRGPRAYTTGPGIFDTNHIGSVRQAKCILRRYRDHYRTAVVKSYMIGNRWQRQQMAEAARELGMMLIAENWGVPRYALTQAIDGFATNEHASGAVDYFDDVAQLYSRTAIGYSPTTLIGGAAGVEGIHYFLPKRKLLEDEKLNRYMPRLALDERLRGVEWQPDEQFIIGRLAASAGKVARAGGHVAVGSHSELQGLGYHWEMQALAMGGLTPREVLQIATRGTATVLGRVAQTGSLEPGKYADLIVFERDPLLDIANSESLVYVMKNGRLYDAATLQEASLAPGTSTASAKRRGRQGSDSISGWRSAYVARYCKRGSHERVRP